MTSRALVQTLLVIALAACKEASHPAEPNEPQAPQAPPLSVLAVYEHPASAGIKYTLFENGTFVLRYGNWAEYG
jgi:hypothetical protein